MYVSMLFLRWC